MTQWVVIISMVIMMAGVSVAQGMPASPDLSGDYEEFKRYEAFRKSQLDALEKQRAAGVQAEYDEFQLFKQYRELRKQSTAQPTIPSSTTVPPSGSLPNASLSSPPIPPIQQAEQDLKEAYKRYQSVKAMEITPSPTSHENRPVSFGWDWVVMSGVTNLAYKNGPASREFWGLNLGIGGRFSVPLGRNTSFLVGPEVSYTSFTSKGGVPIFISTTDSALEWKQAFLFLTIPIQLQQRMGPFHLSVGAYASRPLMAEETKTNLYRWDAKKDIAPYLREWALGGTLSLTYTVAVPDVQFGFLVQLPFTGFMKEDSPYRESRLATYGLQVTARL